MNDAARIARGTVVPEANATNDAAFARFARAVTRRYVVPPLLLSVAVAAAAAYSGLAAVGRLQGEAAAWLLPLVERFAGNDFGLCMLVVFMAALFYGSLQLAGAAVDRERIEGLGRSGSDRRVSWLALPTGRPYRLGGGAVWREPTGPDPLRAPDRFEAQRRHYAELGLLPLRFSVWVLPLLGFIGTVVGVARSIVGLESVIATGPGGQSADGLLTVLGGLRFAFDTTLMGLASVIPVMILQTTLAGRESAVTDEGRRQVLELPAPPPPGPDSAAG